MVAELRCCGSLQKYILPNLSVVTILEPSLLGKVQDKIGKLMFLSECLIFNTGPRAREKYIVRS